MGILRGGALVQIEVFDPADLSELPEEARKDLLKAAQRLRDGDLSGAIPAACGASFQERCKRASSAKGVIPAPEEQLKTLGWPEADIVPFKKNFEGALTQGAYVMQILRSKMGDVHDTKPIIKPLVFDSLKWAALLVRSLSER